MPRDSTKFAFHDENMTEGEVRSALASVFGERAAKIIGDAAIPVATGVNRAPGLPPADGCAGGALIALDWYHEAGRFRWGCSAGRRGGR
jgi:hypothetical protein